MSEEIKELENTPEKAVYKVGKGKDALTLSVSAGLTSYKTLDESGQHEGSSFTDYLELKLSSNNHTLYEISEKAHTDDWMRFSEREQELYHIAGTPVDEKKLLAEKLYKDNSMPALAIKKIIDQIDDNPLIGELKQQLHLQKVSSYAKQEEMQKKQQDEQKRKAENEQRKLTEAQNKENAENALNKFVRVDNQDTNDAPVVPEKGLKKYRSGILGLQYLKNLRTKMVQFFSRGRKE